MGTRVRWRRRGAGGAIARHFAEAHRARGAGPIELSVLPSAVAFWRSVGFEEVPEDEAGRAAHGARDPDAALPARGHGEAEAAAAAAEAAAAAAKAEPAAKTKARDDSSDSDTDFWYPPKNAAAESRRRRGGPAGHAIRGPGPAGRRGRGLERPDRQHSRF